MGEKKEKIAVMVEGILNISQSFWNIMLMHFPSMVFARALEPLIHGAMVPLSILFDFILLGLKGADMHSGFST